MELPFTATQKQRLIELDSSENVDLFVFKTEEKRDQTFQKLQKELVLENRKRLQHLREVTFRPQLRILESQLVEKLTQNGFVEVVTPIFLAKGMLNKMGIGEGHALSEQIYWIDKKTCLRPMLAPNLYHLLGHLPRTWSYPIRIFEIGSCFRKESKGARHLSEFTMLNLVEMGMEGDPQERLMQIIGLIMDTMEISYSVENEHSDVYGQTIDIVVAGEEIASGAIGPHPLDANWNIADSWAGLGIGLERLLLLTKGFTNIKRTGRSLIYLDGARLNI